MRLWWLFLCLASLLQVTSPLAKVISRKLKVLALHLLIYLFSFSPFWELDIKDQGSQKQVHTWEKLESHYVCPGVSINSKMT
jgi:hypothetical protein